MPEDGQCWFSFRLDLGLDDNDVPTFCPRAPRVGEYPMNLPIGRGVRGAVRAALNLVAAVVTM